MLTISFHVDYMCFLYPSTTTSVLFLVRSDLVEIKEKTLIMTLFLKIITNKKHSENADTSTSVTFELEL